MSRARADAHVLVGLGRRAREARIDDDHLGAGLLGMQHVQHATPGAPRRRCEPMYSAALAVLHVVVRIGHRAVAPGVGDAGDRGGVADARLVVAVVGAPEATPTCAAGRPARCCAWTSRRRRSSPGRSALRSSSILALISFSAWSQLMRSYLPLTSFIGYLQAVLAVAVLAQRRALGAVRAEVDRRVEHRLLAHPDAVLDHRVDGAAHRAVAADGALDLDLACRRRRPPARRRPAAFFTSVSCDAAMPTPTPRPERRRKARRSIVGMARETPRARLATRLDAVAPVGGGFAGQQHGDSLCRAARRDGCRLACW